MKHMITWIRKHGGTIVSVAALAVLAFFGVYYRREIWAILVSQEARDSFISYVRESGLVGLALFFGLQILQIVVAVLPGEPVELMAGLLYGTWGGLAVCLAGVALSTLIVYYCVRAAGAKALDQSALKKYRFLRDEAHVKLFLFVLFFIPGTPKDVLRPVPACEAVPFPAACYHWKNPVDSYKHFFRQAVCCGELAGEPGGDRRYVDCGGAVPAVSGADPHVPGFPAREIGKAEWHRGGMSG